MNRLLFIVVIMCFFVSHTFAEETEKEKPGSPCDQDKSCLTCYCYIKKEFLIAIVSVSDVERRNAWFTDDPEWRELKKNIRRGDELWEFCSPIETWRCLSGRQGFVLLRNGKAVFYILTREN